MFAEEKRGATVPQAKRRCRRKECFSASQWINVSVRKISTNLCKALGNCLRASVNSCNSDRRFQRMIGRKRERGISERRLAGRNQIPPIELRRAKFFARQNAMISTEQTETEVNCSPLKENLEQRYRIGQRVHGQPNKSKVLIDIAENVAHGNEQEIVNDGKRDDAEPVVLQICLRIFGVKEMIEDRNGV